MVVIAVGLLILGGGLAVALGIGRDETATPTSDSVDAGFARDMSRHHQQGVEMANLVAERSSDPEVRLLAFDISSTQNSQVGRMQGWLTLWGLPPSDGSPPMEWMGSAHHMTMGPGDLMPGMASEEELAHLRSLSGRPFDVQFLRLMIRHHQGGRDMAEYAAAHAQVAAVRDLAKTIADTQTAETTTMAAMLAAGAARPSRRPESRRPERGHRLVTSSPHDRFAPVAQGIEHCPPEAGAQVRILPGAPPRSEADLYRMIRAAQVVFVRAPDADMRRTTTPERRRPPHPGERLLRGDYLSVTALRASTMPLPKKLL